MKTLTFETAVSLTYRQEVHHGECKLTIGKRGGRKLQRETWRVNGRVKTWKTRPGSFEIPIKYGFNGPYNYITEHNMEQFHLYSECGVLSQNTP